jgi:hypothetical protein
MPALLARYNAALEYASHHGVGNRYQEHSQFWQQQWQRDAAYIGKTEGVFPADAVTHLKTTGVVSHTLPDLTVHRCIGSN